MKKKKSKKAVNKKKELNQIADFLYEVGMLQKTPRSGFQFLGSGNQSVAEHLHRTSAIAYTLALMSKLDPYKVATMAIFHDISESRISDLNYVHQKYNTRLEDKAHEDIVNSFPFGGHLKALIDEYEERETIESKIVKDADNLEWIMSLKEQVDIGNVRAEEWLSSAYARLKTDEAKELAKVILDTRSDRWWFGNPKDGWWSFRKEDISK
jgi:putative hydrolase of HD superfamily